MNRAIISVGSNVEPEANVEAAREILSKEQRLVKASRFIRTKPRGVIGQPDFINGAVIIETALDRGSLVAYLKDVEARLGRVRTSDKNAPRTIDLDIAVFNGEIVGPDVERYDFVREAVKELAPELGL